MTWQPRILQTALLLMETLWVYAFIALVVAACGNPGEPSLLGVAAVVFLSFSISRLLQQSDLDLGLVRAWGTVASLLLFYAVVRIDLFDDPRVWDFAWLDRLYLDTSEALNDKAGLVIGVVLLWLAWMRGILRGQQPLLFEGFVTSFAVGVIIVAFVALLEDSAEAPPEVGYVIVPYIAIGLLTIGLAHAARSQEEFGRSFSSTWMLAVGGAVLALAGLATIFVLVDLGTLTDATIDVLRTFGWLLGRIAYVILYPVFWVLQQFVEAMASVVRFIFGDPQPLRREELPQDLGGDDERRSLFDFPGWVDTILRVLALGGVGAAIVAMLALLFHRYHKRRGPAVVTESTYHEGRLSADLSGLLNSVLGRLRPSFGSQQDAVRRLYFEMLAAAERRGVQRRAGETPLELAPRLNETFAAVAPGHITEAFDDVRYGGLALTPDQVRRLRDEWDSVV